jgi:WD40 repeat protein
VATCGLDKTVRIWNYLTKQVEVVQSFVEEPYCLAIHPTGFYMVVGFADKVRLMNIYSSTIKPLKDLTIKNCHEVRFSHGGHLFACASNQVVQIFNFYTLESPPNLVFKGHG